MLGSIRIISVFADTFEPSKVLFLNVLSLNITPYTSSINAHTIAVADASPVSPISDDIA